MRYTIDFHCERAILGFAEKAKKFDVILGARDAATNDTQREKPREV